MNFISVTSNVAALVIRLIVTIGLIAGVLSFASTAANATTLVEAQIAETEPVEPPLLVSLIASKTVLGSNEWSTLTAVTSRPIQTQYVFIYDRTEQRIIWRCQSATETVCSHDVQVPYDMPHKYVAYVADDIDGDTWYWPYSSYGPVTDTPTNLSASSGIVAIAPMAWSVRISRNGNTVTSVTNQVHGEYNAPPHLIFDMTTGERLELCSTQTCSGDTSYLAGHVFKSFVAGSGAWSVGDLTDIYADSDGYSKPMGEGYNGAPLDPKKLNVCAEGVSVCKAADPVVVQTGELNEDFTDIEVSGVLPMNVERSYKGFNNTKSGQFGNGWTWLWDSHLAYDVETQKAVISLEDGSEVEFTGNDTDGYVAPSYITATLTHSDGNWYLTRSKNLTYRFDSTGNLTKISDRLDNTIQATWSGGNVSALTDDAGRQVSFTAISGRISTATSPRGVIVAYGYSGDDLTSVTYPGSKTMSYGYDSNDRLISIENPEGGTTTNAYDSSDRVVSQVDPAGGVTGFDFGDHQTTITHPDGEVERQIYSNGLLAARTRGVGTPEAATWMYQHDAKIFAVTEATDPLGRITKTGYDSNGNKTSTTDPLGNTTSWTYNTDRQLTSQTAPDGTTTSTTYDSNSRVTDVSMPFGGATVQSTYVYNDTDNPTLATAITDTTGRTTVMEYDAYGNRVSVTDAAGHTTTRAYDLDGNQTWQVSANGNEPGKTPADYKTEYTFNALNQPMSETNPLSHVTTYVRDNIGNILSATNPENETATFTYDALDRVTKRVHPDGTEMNFTYDNVGNVLTEKDSTGRGMTYIYDVRGNVIKSTTATGKDTTYTYDLADNLVSTKAPRGGVTTFTYDANNQMASTTSPVNGTTTTEYNTMGQVKTTTDPLGNVTAFTYNPLGNQTKIVRADQTEIKGTFDSEGRVLSTTNANNKQRVYTYDAAGRQSSVTDALSATTSYDHDADGRVVGVNLPGAKAVDFMYNRAGLLTAKDYNDNTPDVGYGYDNAGRRVSMTDGTGNTAYAYTDGNLSSVEDGHGKTVFYGYNPLGDIATITYPNSQVVTRGYDDAGQLTSVKDWNNYTTGFTYDDDGNLSKVAYPNGVEQTMGHDDAGAMTSNTVNKDTTALATLVYSNSAESTLVGADDSISGANETYGYDTLNRLKSLTSGAANYGHDSAGNVTTLSNGAALTYNDGDQVTNLAPMSGTATDFTYNDLGARTQEQTGTTTTNYGYNLESSLTSWDNGTNAYTYGYNGDGLRSDATTGTTTDSFAWDVLNDNAELLTDGDHAYIYGPGGRLVEQVNLTTGGTLYAATDQIGSVRMTTDSTGAVEGTASYDPYGKPLASSTTGTKFGFSGEYTDTTGLIYLRARYYDPNTAQFLSIDPLVDLTGDTYGYASGNPLYFTDPSGLLSFGDIGNGIVNFATSPTVLIGAASIVVGAVASTACIAVTAGACVVFVPLILGATGAAAGALDYAVTGDCQTPSGYAKHIAVGGALGALGGGGTAAAIDKIALKKASGQWSKFDDVLDEGFLDEGREIVLSVGTKVDRYGTRGGAHVSPAGTAFGQRSLPEVQRFAIRRIYAVKKPITVRSGEVAPGVGQVGGGVQHLLPESVKVLQRHGSLKLRLW